MKWAVEKLKRARQRLVSISQPVAREFEMEDKKIAPVRVDVLARGALVVSKEERGPSLTVESRNLTNFEAKTVLDIMVILKGRQQQKCAFERDIKATKAAAARKRALETVMETSVVVLDNKNSVFSGLQAVKRKRSSQRSAYFDVDFKDTDTAPKEVVSDP